MKYTFTNFTLTEDLESQVNSYLSRGLHDGTIIQVDGYYFDIKSLSISVNLDCLFCERVCETNCCMGHPYPPQPESISYVKENAEEIFEDPNAGDLDDRMKCYNILKERDYTVLMGNRSFSGGYIKKTKGMETFPSFKENGCVFNTKCDGVHKCAIHAHCLTKGINPILKKPIYCSMYPLCSIDLNDNEKFIFCVIDKDIKFSLWSRVDFTKRPCSNIKLLDTHPKDREYFKEEDYIPVFKASINSLKYFIPDDILYKIDKLL